MMRIIFPTLTPFPSSEAPAIQVAHMAQALGELGHDVTLVTPVALDADVASTLGHAPAFRTLGLSSRIHRGQSYLHALRIDAMSRRDVPDLILSRNLRACLLPARRGVPTVFEAHTLSALTGPQERWILARLARAPGFRGIVAISAALAADLSDELAVDPDRILVAHDAVRLEAAPIVASASGQPPHVVYTGSLFPGKGADLVIDVAARCPWATFSVAGGPPELATDLRGQVETRALTNVSILGPITPVAARHLQASADVLVAPFSRRIESDSGHDIARWTSPMKVFEYMASGRPIVISDLPVLHEILRADVDALMVEPEDVDALLGALQRLRDDPALGARLAASALERVRAEFTWEIRAQRIVERFCA